VQRDKSPGRRVACNSPSEGTRFRHSRQSRPGHPGVWDGNNGRSRQRRRTNEGSEEANGKRHEPGGCVGIGGRTGSRGVGY